MTGKRLRKMLALGTAVCMFGASSLSVSAAGLKDVFDAEYYADRYADLEAAFGDDENALYQHFLTYGLKEGRNMSPILDVVAYRAAYPDLDAAFGDNWNAYVEHFLTYGAKENRTEGVLFNPVQYEEAYADVKAACGDDLQAVVEHYLTNGIAEGRTEGTSKGYDSISALQVAEAEAAAAEADDEVDDEDSPQSTEKRFDNSDGSYYIETYDENGDLVKMTIYYYSSGEVSCIATYYSNGNLKKSVTYEKDGSIVQTCTSNEDGTVVSYVAEVNEISVRYTYEYADNVKDWKCSAYHNGTLTGYWTKTYAENGSDYTELWYDANGNFEYGKIYNATTEEYIYCDEGGNPITDSTETDSSESEDTTSEDTTSSSSASE